MKLDELVTIAQLKGFPIGTEPAIFLVEDNTDAVYAWIQSVLVKFAYLTLSKRMTSRNKTHSQPAPAIGSP